MYMLIPGDFGDKPMYRRYLCWFRHGFILVLAVVNWCQLPEFSFDFPANREHILTKAGLCAAF